MSVWDNALEWIRERTGGTYSMPLPMESFEDDDWAPEKGHRVHIVPSGVDRIIRADPEYDNIEKPTVGKTRTFTRLPSKQEIAALLTKCIYCDTSQFLEDGSCHKCGGALPKPNVPEIIVEEKTVYVDREPSVMQPMFITDIYSSGVFGICTTDTLTMGSIQ